MASAGKELYSQAFNFGTVSKGVDPRTGQYNFSIVVYEVPSQARNCPSLSLSINYNSLTHKNTGLGEGWVFNLSSYDHRKGKTLFLSTGEHYKVTEGATLSIKEQKLKSFEFIKKDGNYAIIYKDGRVEILSNLNNSFDTSVPVKIYAANGSLLNLEWGRAGSQPRLTKIQEVINGVTEDLLEVRYGVSQVEIIHAPNTPETCKTTLVQKNKRLVELQLPSDGALPWQFVYKELNSITCITDVKSPAGLLEKVNYSQNGHKLPKGGPYVTIPYAISHMLLPGFDQPPIETNYRYSEKNFLAYNSGLDWKEGEDNLYRVHGEYQYSTTVQLKEGAETKYSYNKFHLLTTTEQQQSSKKVSQTISYHALTNSSFDQQPAQYQLPKSLTTNYQDLGAGTHRQETSEHVFDEWGNPTETTDRKGIKTTREYYSPSGESDRGTVLCPADPYGFKRYLKRETVVPKASGPTRGKILRYLQLPTTANAHANYFVAAQQLESLENNSSISAAEFSYTNQPTTRDHGRLLQQVTHLSGQKCSTYNWTFTYPNGHQFSEQVKTTSFDGFTEISGTAYSMCTGLITSHMGADGVEEEFKYDSIGRLVQAIVSPGQPFEAIQRKEYATGDSGAGYRMTTTDAQGLQTRYIMDGLERVCRIERQDIDDGGNLGPFRIIQESTYDAIGRPATVCDIDWLRTNGAPKEQRNEKTMDYDDWGQLCRVRNPDGTVTSSITDPINLTHTEGTEGQSKVQTQYNLFGTPTLSSLLRTDGTPYSKTAYNYDGLGRLIKRQDDCGHVTLYQNDSFDRVVQTTRPDQSIVYTQYFSRSTDPLPISIKASQYTIGEQSFDGLSRLTRQKIGGRTVQRSYRGSEPEPFEITTSSGSRHDCTYEPGLNYALTLMKSSDDSNTYQYDPKSLAVSQLENSYCSETRHYLPSGLLAKESFQINNGGTSAKHQYSMLGKLQSYTDVHGQQRVLDYDSFGRLKSLTQGKSTVTFTYDQFSRPSETRVLDGETGQSLTTVLDYDEFSREIQRTVSKGKNMIYQLDQTYNQSSFLVKRRVTDGKGETFRDESFQYDSFDRLIGYQCTGSRPPVDERGSSLKEQNFSHDEIDNLVQISTSFQDGTRNIASYVYSRDDHTRLVQITNTHPNYSPNINLEYDSNGCLTRDEQGRSLRYDTLNRLTAVCSADGHTLAKYHYDAAGKLVCQDIDGGPSTLLHYSGENLVARTEGKSQISYISDGKECWGEMLVKDGHCQTELWASDMHQSILAWLDKDGNDIHHQEYTPYGYSNQGPSKGFNGQWRDPVTGWYHLGNGYRVYNPTLMRFHTPDDLTPYSSGELNPYAYCLGDPINRVDPTGHFSIFGIHFGGRDLALALVGLVVGVAVGVLTGGAGFAVEAALGIAAGVASDVVTGVVYDVASGKKPTWGSVGTDALYGAIGGVFGEGIGRGIAAGGRAVARGFRGARTSIEQFLEGASKLRRAGGQPLFPWSSTPKSFKSLERQLAHLETFKKLNKLTRGEYSIYQTKRAQLIQQVQEVRSRQPWTFNERNKIFNLADPKGPSAEKYGLFRDYIREQRFDPRTAAGKISGDANFKELQGTAGQYQIKLNRGERATFTIDWESRIVDIIAVGGHT